MNIIKYQDSELIAYETNSQVNYSRGEEVYILILSNDWDKNKTIVGSVNNKATTFIDIPDASSLYNRLGTNLITLSQKGELCSYKQGGDSKKLYDKNNDENNIITIIDQVINRYIKTGNALALGMTVKINLNDSQVGGDYGLVLNLKFQNDSVLLDIDKETEWENTAVRSYTVSSKDIISNPYRLRSETLVETLIEVINIGQFLGVQSIEIFCDEFPQNNKQHPADIFNKGIYVYGADVLDKEQLNGYVVHIDCSETGNILDAEEGIDTIKLNAQLKAKGQIVTQDAQYYWFRQNGLVFRGSPKYNGRAGEGWYCLNYQANIMAVPQDTG